jgi:hypothetical protein
MIDGDTGGKDGEWAQIDEVGGFLDAYGELDLLGQWIAGGHGHCVAESYAAARSASYLGLFLYIVGETTVPIKQSFASPQSHSE